MPRKRHVSRNLVEDIKVEQIIVMPRKRHVSRNTAKQKRAEGSVQS